MVMYVYADMYPPPIFFQKCSKKIIIFYDDFVLPEVTPHYISMR